MYNSNLISCSLLRVLFINNYTICDLLISLKERHFTQSLIHFRFNPILKITITNYQNSKFLILKVQLTYEESDVGENSWIRWNGAGLNWPWNDSDLNSSSHEWTTFEKHYILLILSFYRFSLFSKFIKKITRIARTLALPASWISAAWNSNLIIESKWQNYRK